MRALHMTVEHRQLGR